MASFTVSGKLLQLCFGLVCVTLYVVQQTLCSSLHGDELKAHFKESKAFWLKKQCVFLTGNDYEANPNEPTHTDFTLKACSSEKELAGNDEFGMQVCELFFSVSKTLCMPVEEENLRPADLAPRFNNMSWNLCAEAADRLGKNKTFAFITGDVSVCESQCLKNEKIAPVCRLLVALVLTYEDAVQKDAPAEAKNTTPASVTEDMTSPSQGENTAAQHTEEKKVTTPAPKKTTSPPQDRSSTASSTEKKVTTPAPKKTTSPPQDRSSTASSTEKKVTTPVPKKTTSPPQDRSSTATSTEEKKTTPVEKMTSPPQDRNSTATPTEEKTTVPMEKETASPAQDGDSTAQHYQPDQSTTSFISALRGEVDQTDVGDGGGDNSKDQQQPPVDTQAGNQKPGSSPNSEVVDTLDLEKDNGSSGSFMIYFVTVAVLCVAAYVIYHSRRKIMAFIVEGRQSGRHSRSGSSGNSKHIKYSKLKPSAEELLPSLDKSVTTRNFIY